MTNVKKLFDKVTKDVTTDERKKGTHTARKDSMIDNLRSCFFMQDS